MQQIIGEWKNMSTHGVLAHRAMRVARTGGSLVDLRAAAR